MQPETEIIRPILAPGTRYRWDKVRRQHQLVFPEGVLVLNESGAAIVQAFNGRTIEEIIAVLSAQYEDKVQGADARAFLRRLADRRLICDSAAVHPA